MRRHLADKELLEYQFALDDERRRQRVARHLAECPACQRRAADLAERLGMLESLRSAEPPSERLIAQTLRAVRVPRREPEPTAIGWIWGSAVTAAVVILLVSVYLFWPRSRQTDQSVAEREPVEPEELAPIPETPVTEEIAVAVEHREAQVQSPDVAIPTEIPPETAEAPRPSTPPALGGAERAFSSRTAEERRIAQRRKRRRARRAAAVAREAPRLQMPRGWAVFPTNEVRVLVIPLLAKADGLQQPTNMLVRTWLIRVRNESDEQRVVLVRRSFDTDEWSVDAPETPNVRVLRGTREVAFEFTLAAHTTAEIRCVITEPRPRPVVTVGLLMSGRKSSRGGW